MKKARSLLLPFRRVNTPQRTTVNCCEIPGSPPSSCEEIERRPTHAMQPMTHTTDVTCTTTAYSATKRSFLSRTHIVAVVLHTSSHSTVQATYVDTCSPVRTLGVLPTYEHTKRTLWEAGYQLYPRLRLLNTRTVSPSERWQLVHAFGKLYGAAEPACRPIRSLRRARRPRQDKPTSKKEALRHGHVRPFLDEFPP